MASVDTDSASVIAPENAFVKSWRPAVIIFCGLVAASIGLCWRSASSMAATWVESSAFHHGAAVAPISLWLILRATDWRRASPASNWRGVIVVFIALLAWSFGRAASADVISQLALVLMLIGITIAVFGTRLARSWAFPLAFLFFMVPLGASLIPMLQTAAAATVTGALNAAGVATVRDGVMLTTAAGPFEMAQACAGLQFLIASAMAASLIAHLALSGWRKQVIFVLFSLVAALAANWIRAFLIVALVTLTDRKWGVGVEHVLLGWVFYSALIVLLILTARRLSGGSRRKPRPETTRNVSKSRIMPVGGAILGMLALFAVYDGAVISRSFQRLPPQSLPILSVDGWRLSPPFTTWKAAADNADRRLETSYASAQFQIKISVAYFTHDRDGAEIANYDLRPADGVEWRRVRSSRQDFEYGGEHRRFIVDTIENSARERLDIITLYWLGDSIYASSSSLKLDSVLQKLHGVSRDGGAVFIAAPVAPDASSLNAVRRFLGDAEPLRQWRARISAMEP